MTWCEDSRVLRLRMAWSRLSAGGRDPAVGIALVRPARRYISADPAREPVAAWPGDLKPALWDGRPVDRRCRWDDGVSQRGYPLRCEPTLEMGQGAGLPTALHRAAPTQSRTH